MMCFSHQSFTLVKNNIVTKTNYNINDSCKIYVLKTNDPKTKNSMSRKYMLDISKIVII